MPTVCFIDRVSLCEMSALSPFCVVEIILCCPSVSLIVLEVGTPTLALALRLFCSLCTYWLSLVCFLADNWLLLPPATGPMFEAETYELNCLLVWPWLTVLW